MKNLYLITLFALINIIPIIGQNDRFEISDWNNDGWDNESHNAYNTCNQIIAEVNPFWCNLGSSDGVPCKYDVDGSINERAYVYDAIKVTEEKANGDLFIAAVEDMGKEQINDIIANSTLTIAYYSNNIALNKSVTVSSSENASFLASYAVDGDLSTRWSTLPADPQWISVDLEAEYTIDRVKITWAKSYAKDYQIEVSSDNANWTTIKAITRNTDTINEYTNLSGTGRFIKIFGITRATEYGYSIYELDVNGTLVNPENPGIGDLTDPDIFYDLFDDENLDKTKWTAWRQDWGDDMHGGVVPENISQANGKLVIQANGNNYTGTIKGIDQNTKVGGAIKSLEKFSSGIYEIRAKICPQDGTCSAFWNYENGKVVDGVANVGYCEIDFETKGFNKSNTLICTNYFNPTDYQTQNMTVNYNDGKYHTYRFEWYPASVSNNPHIDYYFDNKLVTIGDNDKHVPNFDAAFWIGVWFPNWAGTPDFNNDYMYVDWFKYTPKN